MENIIDIKSELKSPDILLVLSESIYMPTQERLRERAGMYMNNNDVVAFGYKNENIIQGLPLTESYF